MKNKSVIFSLIVLSLVFGLLASVSFGQHAFYVDQQYGDDNNNGTETFPLRTIHAIWQSTNHSANFTVYIKRGQLFESGIPINVSNENVQFLPYHIGDEPILQFPIQIDAGRLLADGLVFRNSPVSLSNDAILTLNACQIIGNAIPTSSRALTCSLSTINIYSTLVSNWTSQLNGAAIHSHSCAIHIDHSSFSHLSSHQSGAVIFSSDPLARPQSSLSIFNSTFTANNAALQGGVLRVEDMGFTIHSSKFESNHAVDGGAISMNIQQFGGGQQESIILDKCFFGGNTAEKGGVISSDILSSVNISIEVLSCDFTENDASLSGGSIFAIGSEIMISSSIFSRNHASINGGALDFLTSSILISKSHFFGNTAENNGGGIAVIGSNIEIEESEFRNNIAYFNGGGIAMDNDNPLYSSHLVLKASTFFQNMGYDCCGAVSVGMGDNLNLVDSFFRQNYASNGAVLGILMGGTLNVDNSTFEENYADGYTGVLDAFYSSVTITESKFLRNSASLIGVFFVRHSEILTENCHFAENIARGWTGSPESGWSGVAYVDPSSFHSVVWVSRNDEFVRNEASGASIALLLANSEFQNISARENTCKENNGAFYVFESIIKISNGKFMRNYASSGGDVYCEYCKVEITDSVFQESKSNLNGGSILSMFGHVDIKNSTFYNNSAILFNGGAIFEHASIMTVEDCYFGYNKGYFGGALVSSGLSSLLFKRTNFEYNVGYNGGSMSLLGVDYEIANCTFKSNKAHLFGGAIYSFGNSNQAHLRIANTRFIDNNALGSGGGVYCDARGDATFDSCLFDENKASVGAGMSISGRVRAAISNSVISRNTGDMAAGVYLSFSCQANILKTKIIENHSSTDGGGIYIAVTASSKVLHSVVSNNTADFNGGGVFCDSRINLEVSNSTISNNTAKEGRGGGVCFVGSSNANFQNSSLSNNKAYGGGAISIHRTSTVQISGGSIFWGNIANNPVAGGGAIFCEGGHLKLEGSVEFNDNEAFGYQSHGGAIRIQNSCQINNTGILHASRNRAHFGGSISLSSIQKQLPLHLNRMIQESNSAMAGGALYWDTDEEPTLDHTFLQDWRNNEANYGGNIATKPRYIYVEKDMKNVSSLEEITILVGTKDYYGQIVRDIPNTLEINIDVSPLGHKEDEINPEYLVGNTRVVLDSNNLNMTASVKAVVSPMKHYSLIFSGPGLSNTVSEFYVIPCSLGEEERQDRGRDGSNLPVTICSRCPSGTYKLTLEGNCSRCVEGADCTMGGSAIRARNGFWRLNESSSNFFRCTTLNCGQDGCEEGYTGPLCKACSENYFRSGGSCFACPLIEIGYVITIASLLVSVIFIFFLLFTIGTRENHEGVAIRKILVRHLHLLSLLHMSSEAPFSVSMAILGRVTSLTSLDLQELLFTSCINISVSYNFSLVFKMMLPVIILAVIIVWFVFGMCITIVRRGDFKVILSDLLRRYFLLGTLIYTPIASSLVGHYICLDIEYLRVMYTDVTVECFTSIYNEVLPQNIITIILYGLGFPLTCLVVIILIYLLRKVAAWKSLPENILKGVEYTSKDLFSYFTANYRNSNIMVLSEVLEIIKMVALSFCATFFTSYNQLILCSVICFCTLYLHFILSPYANVGLNLVSQISQVILVLTCFSSLMQLTRIFDGYLAIIVDIITSIANVLILLSMFVAMFVNKGIFKKIKKSQSSEDEFTISTPPLD